jgi:excisionase family DNA binding protein
MATDTPTADTPLPELLSVPELSAYLGVPVSTLYLWRTRGEGPPGFKIGKVVRYRASEVSKWLEEQAR